jgi:1-acyl-sn-glycerol-3-phosphate acyltransferase
MLLRGLNFYIYVQSFLKFTPLLKLLAKWYLQLTGWNPGFPFPFEVKKCVIIVAPHTSAWDVFIGAIYRKAVGLDSARFLGKKELFDGPFGFFFKWLGGTPVDRFNKNGLVQQVVDMFNEHEEFRLALSPEGTRKRVDKLRTGFYHIAKGAHVPIVMIGLDFGNKQLLCSEPFYPTDDEAADFEKIFSFYRNIKGKRPEMGLMHL